MSKKYATTIGQVDWDEHAVYPERASDPEPPDEGAWRLVASSVGELRLSRQYIYFFWEKVEA